MSDRCINLRDWEAAAQPGASVIVRPVKPVPGWELQSITKSVPSGVSPCGPGVWWATCKKPEQGWTSADFIDSPLAAGDTAILREKWAVSLAGDAVTLEYYADNPNADPVTGRLWHGLPKNLTGSRRDRVRDRVIDLACQPFRWRTPQTMPSELARWRRPVLSVEAMEIGKVSEKTWIAAGAAPWHFGDPNTLPSDRVYEAWLSTYGPGSWSGWCWVVTLGEVEP